MEARSGITVEAGCLVLLVLLLLPGVFPAASAAPPPVLPPNFGERALSLSSGTIASGASGSFQATFTNPFSQSLASVSLTFQIYNWSAADNSSGGTLGPSDGWAPSFANAGSNPRLLQVSLSSVAAGASENIERSVTVPSGCPAGSYFVRDQGNLTLANGTRYVFLSRGYFSDALWAKATQGAGNTSKLNLTVLNVSGIFPESAIVVSSGALATWIWAFLALSLVLAAIGGYLWVKTRPQPASTSGAKPRFLRKKADRAFGKR
ncbi:MAG: hypothetical protein M1144_06275 [Candidatus Thermoplasmatota archaeon]|jgi:hypothetical protein|nr:hypothetical protein [Candidatus Thermoplasmatota archaeon]MCL5984264.1 hypothetical protein [Candidatus Thermoplasmatota archaeon]